MGFARLRARRSRFLKNESKFRLISAAVIGLIAGLLTSPASADSSEIQVRNYLKSIPVIRAYVVDAPNFGHQKSTLEGLQRLASLGFAGKFEVIYHDRSADKLKAFTQFKSDFITGVTTKYISLSRFNESKSFLNVTIEKLGFIGAEDEFRPMTRASDLMVETLVRVQPPYWGSGERTIEWPNGRVTSLEDFYQLGFYRDFSPVEDISRWIFEKEKSNSLAVARSLQKIYSPKRTHQVMTAYGFHAVGAKVPALYELLIGIRRAQTLNPSQIIFPHYQKPSEDLDPTAPILKDSVAVAALGFNLTPFELGNLKKLISDETTLKDNIEVFTKDEEISFDQPHKKIILYVAGRLEDESIHQLLLKGDLPPTAGGNALRLFLLQHNQPFIEVQNVKLPHLDNFSKKAKDIIADQTLDFLFESKSRGHGTGISRFLLDYYSPSSELKSEFKKNIHPITKKDIVFQAIFAVASSGKKGSCNILADGEQ
jgi:hypothetical protein